MPVRAPARNDTLVIARPFRVMAIRPILLTTQPATPKMEKRKWGMVMTLEELRRALVSASAYRNIIETPMVEQVLSLLGAAAGEEPIALTECYAKVFYALRREGYDGLGGWLLDKLRYEEAPYPLLVEQGGSDAALEAAARRDIEAFVALAEQDFPMLPGDMPRWTPGSDFSFERITAFYAARGAGIFAQYRAFIWENNFLRPVADPDCMGGEELIGYERQRNQVIANTRSLLAGNQVNNVLLYGDSGTGKSVTVKSLLLVPGFDELRLIEVDKSDLGNLPDLIGTLTPRRQKFIIFIDDLAFDQDDRTYSVLKTILEGGLERRPANVAIYATSNRRHLVRQTFSDRTGDEVDREETIAEKTSLSDRFGLRVPYLALDKAKFLAMAETMAGQYGIAMDREELRAAAVKFEARHPGRTPRVVRQFIASLKM